MGFDRLSPNDELAPAPARWYDVFMLLGLLAMATMFGLLVVGVRFMWSLLEMPPPEFEWRAPIDTGPAEPCWTEAIVSDGRFAYSREGCAHDLLMELDARARRDEFPIPKVLG